MRNKNKPFFYTKKKRPLWQTILILCGIVLLCFIWAISVPGIRQKIAEPVYAWLSFAASFFNGDTQKADTAAGNILPTLELPDEQILFAEDISDIIAEDPLAEFRFTPTPTGIQGVVWEYVQSTPDPNESSRLASAPSALLPPPVFERMDINNDGSAILSAALRFFTKDENQYQIAEALRPDLLDPSISFEQMQAYTLENYPELDAQIRINGSLTILQNLLAAGLPVILRIEETNAYPYWQNDDRKIGRCILLTGFSGSRQLFYYQDPGEGGELSISFDDLSDKWYAFARQYCVIFPLDQQQKVTEVLAEDWDEQSNIRSALTQFQIDSEEDADNVLAWHNYGKALLLSGKTEDAWNTLHKAETLGLPQRMCFYDTSILEAAFKSGRADEGLRLSDQVLNRNKHVEDVWLWRGWAYLLKGENKAAADAFAKAQAISPGKKSIEYAIKYLSQIN